MMGTMFTASPFDTRVSGTHGASAPYDLPVHVELVIGDSGAAYVVYDRPFNKPLSWFEYDLDKGTLEFVMEDGEQRNFGIPVSRDIGKYLQNIQLISFIRMNDNHIQDSTDLPLIIHRC